MIKSNLKVLLAKNDMSQKELSIKANVRPNAISYICNNTMKQYPAEALDRICHVLNCDIGDILYFVPDNE